MHMPFNNEELDLANTLNQKGIIWKPKPGDWFLDLSSLRVTYNGDYVQSVGISLVVDQDGRGFSYLELIIDGEENGNRMKKSLSFEERNKISQMRWIPSVSDCISLINKSEDYIFLGLEYNGDNFIASLKNINNHNKFSALDKTPLLAFYKLILEL
jgi:hypothetical protein